MEGEGRREGKVLSIIIEATIAPLLFFFFFFLSNGSGASRLMIPYPPTGLLAGAVVVVVVLTLEVSYIHRSGRGKEGEGGSDKKRYAWPGWLCRLFLSHLGECCFCSIHHEACIFVFLFLLPLVSI